MDREHELHQSCRRRSAVSSDRYQCYLPIGGATGNGAGTYYFKIRSASEHPNFYSKPYQVIFGPIPLLQIMSQHQQLKQNQMEVVIVGKVITALF